MRVTDYQLPFDAVQFLHIVLLRYVVQALSE